MSFPLGRCSPRQAQNLANSTSWMSAPGCPEARPPCAVTTHVATWLPSCLFPLHPRADGWALWGKDGKGGKKQMWGCTQHGLLLCSVGVAVPKDDKEEGQEEGASCWGRQVDLPALSEGLTQSHLFKRAWRTFSEKGQRGNVSRFASRVVSVATAQWLW